MDYKLLLSISHAYSGLFCQCFYAAKFDYINVTQSQPLKRSLTIMKNKASSLPNFLMLDNITENRAANLEAKKQGFDMNEHVVSPSGPTSPDSSLPTHSLHHTFEPPDPVPPTPIRNSESFVASPGL